MRGGDATVVAPRRAAAHRLRESLRSPAGSMFPALASASFALVLLLLAAGGWFTWRNIERIGEDNEQFVRTYEVIQATSELLRVLRIIESNHQIYAFTGDAAALERMSTGRMQLQETMAELLQLGADQPQKQARIRELQQATSAWLVTIDQSTRLHPPRVQVSDSLRSQFAKEHRLIEATRADIVAFEASERERLAARARLAERGATVARATATGATAAAIVLLAFAGFAVRRDLRDRREVALALEHSESRYRVLVESLPYALFVNQGGRIVFANEALIALLGAASPAQVLGRSPLEFVDPSSIGAVKERIRRLEAREAPAAEPIEERWHRCDGQPLTCLVNADLIDWQGAPAILVALNDVTQRTLAESARRESEAQLSAIVSSAMDAIVSMDEEQRIVLFNAAAESMFRVPAAEAIGQPLGRLIPERFRQAHQAHVRRFGETGITSRRMGLSSTLVGLRANGEEFPLEASISQATVSGRRLYTVVIRDVTARERREEELRVAQNQLTHVARLSTMGEMASGLSHEINQPLTAIATYAQALERFLESGIELERDELADVARQMSAQALRAGEVIRRLKAMIRNQAPRFELVSCGALLEDVRALAEVDARLHQVRLSVELRDPQLPVHGNPVQLQQVLLNLIRNAIDAIAELPVERRALELRQRREGGSARIEVIDHGPGIPAAQAENLFRPFFTTKSQGTGLGLAISRTIMAAHQGRLDYQPTPGGGATFIMTLAAAGDGA